jgi:hypothetical protein
MNKLTSFDFIDTNRPLKYLEFSIVEASQQDLIDLIKLGFNFSVTYGRVLLQYDRVALCNLISEEMSHWDNQDEIEDYKEFNKVELFHTWKLDFFETYLAMDKTFEEIFEQIKNDWKLSEYQYQKLRGERDFNYRDDPKNHPEERRSGFLNKLIG